MHDHQYFLREALAVASGGPSDSDSGPFGAIVVRDNEIIGKGRNQVVQQHDPTAHAEIVAIRNAGDSTGHHHLETSILYSSCEPCPMCLAAIYWAHIDTVIYSAIAKDADAVGFHDGFIARELTLPWAERAIRSKQMLADEGRRVLISWHNNPDHKLY